MIDQISPARDNATDILRWAAIAFAIGFGIHGLDHMRRGMSASPPFIMVGGMIQGLGGPSWSTSLRRKRAVAGRATSLIT